MYTISSYSKCLFQSSGRETAAAIGFAAAQASFDKDRSSRSISGYCTPPLESPLSSRRPSLQSQGNIMYNLLIALVQSSGELSTTVYPARV